MLAEKDYCDYDTCVALKELGYVGICDAYYDLTGSDSYNRDSFELSYTRDFIHPDNKDRVAAPLLYQAQKWLREDKKLHIDCGYNPSLSWYYYHVWKGQEEIAEGEAFPTYEDALNTAIYMATEILKEEK